MRAVCASLIDFTRASISGPPPTPPLSLRASFASSSSPHSAYQTQPCSRASSLALLAAIHLERCKYPPAFSTCHHPCSPLSNPRPSRPRSAPSLKAQRFAHCHFLSLFSSRSLIVIRRVSFINHLAYPLATGLSWPGL